ncbi:hypothetical protein J2T04_004060 [Chryseobacterium lathyri]|uniref:PRC-barrel domain-containing protein n=1 Tax=Chryseobacterium lathyri TaxID=395933 RepID=A0ABT9SRQ1_9FLAO|nr:hypothetical protein [Chryseobacterium lathyri]MDQ0068147.1 hypothetical protein [Chryseobacterium lathyri]
MSRILIIQRKNKILGTVEKVDYLLFPLELVYFQNICTFVLVINSWKVFNFYLPLMVN